MINLDFADIKTVMMNMGSAMMGTGESSGEDRAKNAAQAALNNPLLDDTNIKGARSILLNIQGGPDMALFEVDEAASKIRNEVDENANIIFGSSIDNNLEGIIKVSVVATGINKNENQNYFENRIDEDQLISKNENLGLKTEDFEDKTTTTSIGEDLEITGESGIDQIDLVSEINRLDIKKENVSISDKDGPNLYVNSEKLKSIFDNKPDNQFTQSKPQSLLNRVSSFFGKDKISEIKLDPNLNLQKDIIDEKKFENSNMMSNPNQDDQSLHKKHTNEINFDLNINDEIFENKSDNIDLFNNENQSSIDKHQIDLTKIEREDEDIDEKVLEIPAFLRRQAN
jgi:hypothetical protein